MEKSNEKIEELEKELKELNKNMKRQKWINVYLLWK